MAMKYPDQPVGFRRIPRPTLVIHNLFHRVEVPPGWISPSLIGTNRDVDSGLLAGFAIALEHVREAR
jgi:hypothetical protein